MRKGGGFRDPSRHEYLSLSIPDGRRHGRLGGKHLTVRYGTRYEYGDVVRVHVPDRTVRISDTWDVVGLVFGWPTDRRAPAACSAKRSRDRKGRAERSWGPNLNSQVPPHRAASRHVEYCTVLVPHPIEISPSSLSPLPSRSHFFLDFSPSFLFILSRPATVRRSTVDVESTNPTHSHSSIDDVEHEFLVHVRRTVGTRRRWQRRPAGRR